MSIVLSGEGGSEEGKVHLTWKDYVALFIAVLQTLALPFVIMIIIVLVILAVLAGLR
jgi:hypothetical protein